MKIIIKDKEHVIDWGEVVMFIVLFACALAYYLGYVFNTIDN